MTTYVESTLGCCRTFRLEGAKLTVEKKTNRQVVSDAFDLAIVASGSTRVKLMNMPALNRSMIYLGVVLIVAIVARATLPISPVWIAIAAAVLSLPALRVILYYARPVEVEQFKDAHGKVLFDFIRPPKVSPQLEEFLALLRTALEKKEPKSPEPTSGQRPDAAHL